jgi:hypothetical protein
LTTHLDYLKSLLAALEESPTNAGAADLLREQIAAEEPSKPKPTKKAAAPAAPTEGAVDG